MTARERVARVWHDGSDHAADGVLFGGPLCDCDRIAGRIVPLLRDAWRDCAVAIQDGLGAWDALQHNPYESEEGRHADPS